MDEAFLVIAGRYSDVQINKALEILGDLGDELKEVGFPEESAMCSKVFDYLAAARAAK